MRKTSSATGAWNRKAKVNPNEAALLFEQAWQKVTTDLEKLASAHYVARHQNSILNKINWDEMELSFALKIDEPQIKATLPSMYLNIVKMPRRPAEFRRGAEELSGGALLLFISA